MLRDDEWLHVFTFLHMEDLIQVEKVCVRWNELIVKLLASKHYLIFYICKHLQMHSALDLIKRCGLSVRNLTITGKKYELTDEMVQQIAVWCPNLVKVDFSCSKIGDHGLRALTSNCINLNEITVRSCWKFSANGLEHLMNCTSLKRLHASIKFGISLECFNQMKPQLENLTLENTILMGPVDLSEIFLVFKNLKELHLIGDFKVNRSIITKFCEGSVSVKHLEISSIGFEGDSILGPIYQMNWLEILNLSTNSYLHDELLANISRGCPNLRALNIGHAPSGISESSLKLFAKNCQYLVELDITEIEKVTDATLSEFSKVGILRRLIACQLLSITNQGCIDIVTHCPQLELMDISGCTAINEEFISHCVNALQTRTNKLPLKLLVGKTGITREKVTVNHPLLQLDYQYESNSMVIRYTGGGGGRRKRH